MPGVYRNLADPVRPKPPNVEPELASKCIMAFNQSTITVAIIFPANMPVFEVAIPSEAKKLGLSLGQTRAHATQLLIWSAEHEDVLLGLALLRLCYLPEFRNLDSSVRIAAERVA